MAPVESSADGDTPVPRRPRLHEPGPPATAEKTALSAVVEGDDNNTEVAAAGRHGRNRRSFRLADASLALLVLIK